MCKAKEQEFRTRDPRHKNCAAATMVKLIIPVKKIDTEVKHS